jgi:signal transduction histidine kinase
MSFHSGERIALQLSAFDIADVVREVQADTAARHGAGIQASGAFVRGWWDRQAMRRALENMVGNAVKYGREASPVSIRADTLHGRLVLSVHNEGEPIPAAEQEDIFQMYRRAEAARLTRQPGWGIGLPYVRAVAESHGGSVGIDSSAERGTTFTMDVPIDCRPLANAPTPASA